MYRLVREGTKGTRSWGWEGEVKGPVWPGWACRERGAVSAFARAQRGRERPAPEREGAPGLKATPAGGDQDNSPHPECSRLRAALASSAGWLVQQSAARLTRHERPDRALSGGGNVAAWGPQPQLEASAGAAAGAG